MSEQAAPSGSLLRLGVTAGIAAAVGYCIYYDYKRTHAPDYQQKVTEKRRKRQQSSSAPPPQQARSSAAGSMEGLGFDPQDAESVKQFFLQEMNVGQALLNQNQHEEAVKHLANAVRVYGEPGQLIEMLRRTLPPDVFMLLMKELAPSLVQGGGPPQQ